MTTLECYIDELVDCFEDFVKKSLVLLSVAAGAIVLMLFYVLKMLTLRFPESSLMPNPLMRPMAESSQSIPNVYDDNMDTKSCHGTQIKCIGISSLNQLCTKRLSNCLLVYPDPISASATAPIPVRVSCAPSCNELVLKDIGYTNCTNENPDPENPKKDISSTRGTPLRKSISQPIQDAASTCMGPVNVENVGTGTMDCCRQINPDSDIRKQCGSTKVIPLRKCRYSGIRMSKSLNTASVNVTNMGTAATASYSDFGDPLQSRIYPTPSKHSVYSLSSVPCVTIVGSCLSKRSPACSFINLHRRHCSRHSCCSKCCH